MKTRELIKKVCKRCGKEIYTTYRFLEHPLKGICSACATIDEEFAILEYQGKALQQKYAKSM
jgi:hypothetical protein